MTQPLLRLLSSHLGEIVPQMAPNLEPLIDRLWRAQSRDDLQTLSVELRDLYGIAHIVYHWVNSDGEQYGVGTYPMEWVQHYLEHDYLRVDPVIQGCYQRFHPVDWKRLDWSSKAARGFLKEAVAFGLGNQGFSIPIRGPQGQFALFTLNDTAGDPEWAAFTENNLRDLILIAHFFNQKALEFEPNNTADAARALSPREVDAMTYLALGYSRAQVANTLDISEHTLRAYIESARFKLGAMNTTHAVARATSLGLIVV